MVTPPSPEKLASCPLFGGLSGACCERFIRHLECVEIRAGQLVYEEGDPARDLYIVAEGRLEILKPSTSAKAVLVDILPGDFFGDMSFIDMQPRSATVRAVQASVLWRLEYSVLRETYQQDLKCYTLMVMNIAREMSRRLRRADTARVPDILRAMEVTGGGSEGEQK